MSAGLYASHVFSTVSLIDYVGNRGGVAHSNAYEDSLSNLAGSRT